VECQDNRFSTKQIERYEKLFLSGQYMEFPFQTDKKVMLFILILGYGVPCTVSVNHIRILQVKGIDELINLSKVIQLNRSAKTFLELS
jgi:hypothetical protein